MVPAVPNGWHCAPRSWQARFREFGVSKESIISIIDDDASVRIALEDLVGSHGFDACAFESAEDFLRSPHCESTACVITDIQMPGMNGEELQRHLRAQGRRTPMIFITAFPEKRTCSRLEAGGALAVLEKPFDSKILVRVLRGAVIPDGEVPSK